MVRASCLPQVTEGDLGEGYGGVTAELAPVLIVSQRFSVPFVKEKPSFLQFI